MDPDEDSDNSSVYVQGLNDNVTLEDLADFFKQCGVVKVRGTCVCVQVSGRSPPGAEHRGRGLAASSLPAVPVGPVPGAAQL